ncbi:MAG TPA: amino acid adenylation domain-containing protein, partial [Blastocatellia bacterium]|nr:amino acid adenylation domain-containing protein [Blastocatellia bacterium]
MERSSLERMAKLSSARQMLLERRLRGEGVVSELRRVASMPRPQRLPLSYGQQRLWFLDRLGGTSTEYNMPVALRLRGELDREALERALNTIVERHESLRTRFAELEGEPVQIIEPQLKLELPVEDLSALGETERSARLKAALARAQDAPFDLARGPLLRLELMKLSESEHVLLRTMHHIVSDGWSEAIFNRELTALYGAFREGRENPLEPLPVQYADYAVRQRQDRESLQTGLAYWKERLAGIPEHLELPADRPRPAIRSFEAEICEAGLGGELLTELKRLSRDRAATLYMTLLAGFGVLLSRYSGQGEIVVGTPIANRQEAELEELIGFFVNTLAMRVKVEPERSFGELMAEVRRTALEAYEHQEAPFEKLVEELSPERSLDRTPIFQVIFALQNMPRVPRRMEGVAVEPIDREELRVHCDLEVHAWESEGELAIAWVYNRALFERWRMEQMVRHYLRVLESIVRDPGRLIGDLELLSPEERRQILEEWNATEQEVPSATLTELIEAQVRRSPEAPAVVFGARELNYRELNARANRLAHLLIKEGVEPEDVVALAVPRSLEMIVALLGILKAGAAYLPLDLDYPAERLAFMLEDSASVGLITTAEIAARLPAGPRRWLLDRSDLTDREPASSPAADPAKPSQAAYVIYTSGSTGAPKGAVIEHAAVVNRLEWMRLHYGISPGDRILQKTPVGFDVSVWELFLPLIAGATLVVAPVDSHKDPDWLASIIREQGITTLHFVPSMLAMFLMNPAAAGLSIRRVFCSGEELSATLRDRFHTLVRAELHNLYGPTEAAVDVTYWPAPPADDTVPVPIGFPVWNTRMYVLDGRLRPVPAGVSGDLYIGGVQLARAYLARPGLTAERFVADPFVGGGARMYRTGDLARWRRDGALLFLGRSDHQVKIRGLRIELGEIETSLRELPEVEQAAVIVRTQREGGADEPRLVGYVVAAEGRSLDSQAIRQQLGRRLPGYLVPAAIVGLEALPLTPNGKLDRRALPEPEWTSAAVWRAPRSPREEILCALFAEVLGVERVGIDDDFFELGGHSLLATRLAARIRVVLGAELAIRTLFQAPSVAELGPRLRVISSDRATLGRSERPERLPLSDGQQRLWFLDRLGGATTEYNMPVALRLRGDLNREALERTLNAIVERHESLRTRFAELEGEPVQIIEPQLKLELPVEDLSSLAEPERAARLKEALIRNGGEPFDLARGPLLRLKLLRLGESEHVLLRTMHHIVSDGWSEAVFNRELTALYEAFREGRENPLEPLPVQYADYVIWQRSWQRRDADGLRAGLASWKKRLAGIPEQLELPADRPRPVVRSFEAELCEVQLGGELLAELKRLSRDQAATLYMTLLAGFGVLLSRYSGQGEVVVGTPIANRPEAELEGLIGFFVNTLAMRVKADPERSFGELMEEVRRTALEAYEHQEVPFEKLVEGLSPERSLDRTPIFQVIFALQNMPRGSGRMAGLAIEPVTGDELKVRFDLEVHAWESEGALAIAWLYNRELFERWRMEQMARHYLRLLEAVVADPGRRIGELELLSPEERRQILEEWNATEQELPTAALPELFEAQVRRNPAAVAVASGGETITYGELNRRANRLAHYLRGAGLEREEVVGVYLERGIGMVAALLGIVKAGGAYLPLDPDYPESRLHELMRAGGVRMVISEPHWAERVRGAAVEVIEPATAEAAARDRTENPEAVMSGENLAYVIYTSGSTGEPKGIEIPHRGVVRLVLRPNYIELNGSEVIAQGATVTFDAATFEIWGALINGGRVQC